MGKWLITLLLIYSTGAWAAEIYDFSQNNDHANTTTTKTQTVQHSNQKADKDPAPPPRESLPASVAGSNAVAHAHNCGSAATCRNTH